MNRIPLLLFSIAVVCFGCTDNNNGTHRDRDPAGGYGKPDVRSIEVTRNRSIDSTATAVQNLPDDTAKIMQLYNLAMLLRKTDTVASATYANYILWLSEETNSDKGRALGNYVLGRLNEDRSNMSSAIHHLKTSAAYAEKAKYNQGMLLSYHAAVRCFRRSADYSGYNEYLTYLEETARRLHDTVYLSYAYEGFGNLYRYLGDYALSVSYYEKSIQLTDVTGDLEQKSTALNNMSLVYEYEADYEEELRIQLQNYEVIRQMGTESYLVLCLSNLSATYDMLNMSDKSHEAIDQAMEIAAQLPAGSVPDKDLASAYAQYGWISMQSGKMDTALVYYRKAMRISTAIQDRKAVCANHGRLAAIFLAKQNVDSAEYHLREKLAIATEINFRKGQIDAWDELAAIKFRSGDPETAYGYLLKSNLHRDSLQSASNASRASELETWGKVREQQAQIQALSHDKEVQQLEIEKRDTLTYALSGGFALVLLLTIVIYRNYRRNRTLNQELELKVAERTLALTRKNNDLKNFIYRSSHDLRSPITSIKGLINIARKDNQQRAIAEYLDKISTVIDRQDSTLNALLKVSRLIEGKVEPETVNINDLLSELIAEEHPSDPHHETEITVKVDPDLSIVADRVILSSLLQNIISNGVKYRRRRSSGKCYVRITAEENRYGVLFTIADNGEGIPEEWKGKVCDLFSRGSSTEEGAGLGLYIVRSSVEILGGTLDFESTFGKGTTFRFWIPSRGDKAVS